MEFLDLTTLQLIWYTIFIVGMFAYAALDGFDIGVGCLQIFVKKDIEHRIFLNAIGPVWDGNSLWVVITGGVLFSGFPSAFATLFSSLYLPMTLLVFGYVLRAAAIEFRSRVASPSWRKLWDVTFAVASLILGFGFGVALANLIAGFPLNTKGEIVAPFGWYLSSYAVVLGLFTLILFMLHGALFLNIKTEGALQARVQRFSIRLVMLLIIAWAVMTNLTLIFVPFVADTIRQQPLLFINELLSIGGLWLIVHGLIKKYEGRAFIGSLLFIASMVINYAFGTFPNLVKSSIDPAASLTLYNSSSSLTMHILFGIAVAGIPLFLLYCGYAYKVFKGKVQLDSMSY